MDNLESNLIDEKLERAIKEFAEAIAESPEFLAYEEARKNLKDDQETQKILYEYEEKRQLFQMFGNPDDSQLQAEFRAYRDKMLTNFTIRNYLKKQDELMVFFQKLGHLINEVAGFDFGQACAPPTGCC